MKRVLGFLLIACIAAYGFAQSDDSGPTEESVLDTARQMHNSTSSESDASDSDEGDEASDSGDESEEDSDNDLAFTPFCVQFVPGLGVPMGLWNVLFGAGVIGFGGGDVLGAVGGSIFVFVEDVAGAAGAGVIVIADDVSGAVGAGVIAIAGNVSMLEIGGVVAIADSISGAQLAGVINIAGDVSGAQVAGVVNVGGSVDGAQVAGVVNVAGSVSGAQVAAIVNIADHVDGVMIGLINIADSVDGVAIGLINIIREGMSDWFINWDAASGHAMFGYQTGTNGLYAIFATSMPSADLFDRSDRIVLAAGLGFRPLDFGDTWVDIDLSAEQVIGDSIDAFFSDLASGQPARWLCSLEPYPAVRISVGTYLFGFLQVYGGVKLGIDLVSDDYYPEEMRNASGMSGELFGAAFTAYPSIFFGLKL
jgi:hypothetical protein